MLNNFRRWLRRKLNKKTAPAGRRLQLELLENRLAPAVVDFSAISTWAGTGSNQAALVVDFHNGQPYDSVVFGYRWNGTASGEDMLKSIAAANSGLYATLYHYSFGDAVFGFGLDRNDGQLNLSPSLPTPFVSGIAMLPNSSDGNAARAAVDSADFYLEDPFVNGYWSYWTSTSSADDWTSSFVGAGDRTLANGDVDGWSYAVGFGDITPSDPVNPNTRPAITTAASISVAEGNTAATTIHAIDPDAGQTLTYSIAGGADASLFAIVPATGALSFIAAPSFSAGGDNVYDVIVKATDNATPNAFDTLALEVTVTDVRVNFADIKTWFGTGSNQAALVVDFHNGQQGDSVVFGYRWNGTASGEDMLKAIAAANSGLYATMYHYSFGDAVFGFGLDRNDGQLNLSPSLPTSFVSGIAMLPNSSDGNAARVAVDSADFYLEDPFVNGYWSYWTSTASADDWTSSFVGAGDRTLANGDVDGWSYAVGFGDITPSDPVNPNTRPAIATAPSISVAEGNTAVTAIQAIDPDAGQTLTYSIAGGADASLFAIVPATGALSFIAAPVFSAGGDNVYDVIVKATDNATPNAFDTLALEVTVTDVRVNFAEINTWFGTGSNQAALVVDFHNGQPDDSVVFGYRWNGTASGEDMLKAIAAANSGLYATMYHYSFGDAVFGFGLDRNDGQLNLSPSLPTSFVSGIAMLPNSSDGNAARVAVDSADFYLEDPFVNGYWSYWTSTASADDWTSSFVGAGDRTLANGDVDGWSYAVGFGDITPSDPVNPNPRPYAASGISASDPSFVAWASGVASLVRGPQDISNSSGGNASYGTGANALGTPDGDLFDSNTHVVSLGDGGSITLTFQNPIRNGAGADFAVFENGFDFNGGVYAELGFVEVSSDGVHFFRFPSISQTQIATQIGFDALDPALIHNLAGQFPAMEGTPFDLEDLAGVSSFLDIDAVTHVRIVDAVGSINPSFVQYDSLGRAVNDPWPTPFASGGFDLDAIGIIHQTDVTPPDTNLTSAVPLFNSTSASFTYAGSDDVTAAAVVTYEVSLDDGPFTAAGSSQTYTGLAEGPHTFRVRARDEAGNVDPSPASVTWNIHTTTNTAPTLAPVTAPAPFAHTAAPPSIALTGSDADGDISALHYSVQVYVDDAAYKAHLITQTKGLADPHAPASRLPFYENTRGLHEKYFIGTGGLYYYILPTGELFQYVSGTATSLNGTLLATLDSSYWANPNLVLTAAPTDVAATYTTVSSNDTSGTVNLVASVIRNFAGTLHMVASVSDGVRSTLTPRAFDVVVTDAAPTLAAVTAPAPFAHTATPPSIALVGDDADDDAASLQYSVQVYVDNAAYRAHQITQTKGLADPHAPFPNLPFYENARGLHEKYLVGTGGLYYYILPTGKLFQFVSGTATSLNGTLLATFDGSYWANPYQLLTAAPTDVAATYTTVSSNDTSGTVNLVASAIHAFEGTLHMVASVTDGVRATLTPRAFDVVVTDSAPTLADVTAPAPFAHTAAPPSITLTGNVAEGAGDDSSLQYSAQVFVDDSAYRAHQLTQSKGLADPLAPASKLPFHENTRGLHEKYFVGTGGLFYYILPTGELFQYVSGTPTSLNGTLLATLGVSYWANPNLVLTATPMEVASSFVTVSGNGTTTGHLNFIASAIRNFAGTLHIVASVSDGVQATLTPRAFDVVVTDEAPTLAPVTAPAPFAQSSTPPSIALTGDDDDDDDVSSLQYSVQVYVDNAAYKAHQLTQSRGLTDPHAPASKLPFYENTRGLHEKYFVGTGGLYYYILQTGEVFQFVSGTPTSLNGTLLATLDASYWANPNLVLTATPTDVAAAYTTVSSNGTSGIVNLVASAIHAFEGTLHMVASVTDGVLATLTPRAFDVVVTDSAPTLAEVTAPAPFAHTAAPPSITLTGNVAAGDDSSLQYSAQVFVDDSAYRAHQLTQSKGLAAPVAPAPNLPFYENARGLHEKYFVGTGGLFYYILPTGELFQYVSGTPTSLNGTLLATLDVSYWANPNLVLTATPTDVASSFVTVSGNGTTTGHLNLISSVIHSFAGTLHMVASVSDGVRTTQTPRAFDVVVTDAAPTLAAVTAPPPFSHTATPPSIALTGDDDDDDDVSSLQYSVKVYEDDAAYQAHQLTQSRGLADPHALFPKQPFYENARGLHEKYFVGTSGLYYYILPTGDLFQYVSGTPTSLNGTLLATLDTSYWANPNLVLTATPTDVAATYTTVSSNGTSGTINFVASAVQAFKGSLHMVASVTDGVRATLTPRAFDVVVTNSAPTLAEVTAPAPFANTTTPPTIALTGDDADGLADRLNLQYSAQVYLDDTAYQAYQLTQSQGLTDPHAAAPNLPFYENARGQGEKYFLGTGNTWYYILPDGSVFEYVPTIATSVQSEFPSMLSGDGILGQTLFPGTVQVSDVGPLNGILVATLDSSYWGNPNLVLTASPTDVSATYVTVSGHGNRFGQLNFIAGVFQNFVGTLHIVASVNDGIQATQTPRAFDVIVTGAAPGAG